MDDFLPLDVHAPTRSLSGLDRRTGVQRLAEIVEELIGKLVGGGLDQPPAQRSQLAPTAASAV